MLHAVSLAAAIALVLIGPVTASAQTSVQITVLCLRAVQPVVADLAAGFHKHTGTEVKLTLATGADYRVRAVADEPGEVIISTITNIDELARARVVIPGSTADLGTVGVGVAVRAGARAPNTASRESLTLAILSASSIGYADSTQGSQGGMHYANILARLGIGSSVETKTQRFPLSITALHKVAAGEIEMAFSPVNEILSVPGVTLAGPFPEALQARITYTAGILRNGQSETTARAFIEYLTTPQARARFRAGGFDPAN